MTSKGTDIEIDVVDTKTVGLRSDNDGRDCCNEEEKFDQRRRFFTEGFYAHLNV